MRIFKIFTNPSYNKIYIPFPFIDIYYFQWNKNQQTSIHNHASKGCLMFLFNGELKEYLYSRDLELKKISTYKSPNLSYINNKKGYHSIKPLQSSKSIHFYYPKGHNTVHFLNK
tara:strand:+ start:1102 stop:1443 length:342 start_codon:yes stop_codon:yes gene_type:complete